jgi:hypothetical protein
MRRWNAIAWWAIQRIRQNFSEVGKSTGSEHWKVTLQDKRKPRFRAAVSKHGFSAPYSHHRSGLPSREETAGGRAVRKSLEFSTWLKCNISTRQPSCGPLHEKRTYSIKMQRGRSRKEPERRRSFCRNMSSSMLVLPFTAGPQAAKSIFVMEEGSCFS